MHIGAQMRWEFRRLMRRLGRRAAAHREMHMLLCADEREITEIGLTHGDVRAMTNCVAFGKAAAARRNQAMAVANDRVRRCIGWQYTLPDQRHFG